MDPHTIRGEGTVTFTADPAKLGRYLDAALTPIAVMLGTVKLPPRAATYRPPHGGYPDGRR